MQRVETTEWLAMGREATRREFEAFYCAHRDDALRLAHTITADRDAASDATQDAFLKVLDRWKRVRTMESPDAFLRRIVVRCSIDAIRARRRQAEPQEPATPATHEGGLAVRHTLAALKPEQQAILALALGEGWTYAEIADSLGIPAGTVASRVHAAKEAFRRKWGDEL